MRQRILNVPGGLNFRDFGGYETVDGGRVKHGRLFRSGELSRLTDVGREAFGALGIGLICDLRRPDERADYPTPFPEALQLRVPIDPGSSVELRSATNLDYGQRVAFMTRINVELARDHAAEYRRVIEALLGHDERGFLVHCTAGKDRTGFAVAVIQLALGVPRELVEEDYLLTNEAIDFEGVMLPRFRAHFGESMSLEDVRAVGGVRLEYLHAALDVLEQLYGGIEAYLETALGLGPEQRERLREQFVDSP